ncbi:hypothetical protein BDP81DRAFT_184965 [Colletotrichum phormii]|uniref:Secreted protein n=1 Tax=Colletotrichum phormii TaxID=359342 RepID=A0AAI9ZZQ6_9PEZI|nr:uncharacterized protein BDP81DRAFT_184965 [Colletotrichum phormii]KAK1639888.1 hypothetical protein BDP81DRAFT_184965 [Colletotrichum phormii]
MCVCVCVCVCVVCVYEAMRGTLCTLLEVETRFERGSAVAAEVGRNRATVVCLCRPRRKRSGPARAVMMTGRAQAGIGTGATLHNSRVESRGVLDKRCCKAGSGSRE